MSVWVAAKREQRMPLVCPDEHDSHSIPYMPVYCDLMKQERVSSLLLSTGGHETANRSHAVIRFCFSFVGDFGEFETNLFHPICEVIFHYLKFLNVQNTRRACRRECCANRDSLIAFCSDRLFSPSRVPCIEIWFKCRGFDTHDMTYKHWWSSRLDKKFQKFWRRGRLAIQ